MFLGIKLEAWLTIAAIIIGPVLALLIQRWQDRRHEGDKRKRQIFQQLLLTLKVPLAPNHVNALNSIPLEFHNFSSVMQGWREYTEHLNTRSAPNPARWAEKKYELLITLVYEIGKSLELVMPFEPSEGLLCTRVLADC